MPPAGEASQRARLLVVGHGVSLGFALFALHWTAAGCQVFADELELAMPDYARLLMQADRVLGVLWLPLAFAVSFALCLDWKLLLHLLGQPKKTYVRLWAYAVFAPVFCHTVICVGWFRWFVSWMFTPIGGLG